MNQYMSQFTDLRKAPKLTCFRALGVLSSIWDRKGRLEGPPAKETLGLPENFERIVTGVTDMNCSERKKLLHLITVTRLKFNRLLLNITQFPK